MPLEFFNNPVISTLQNAHGVSCRSSYFGHNSAPPINTATIALFVNGRSPSACLSHNFASPFNTTSDYTIPTATAFTIGGASTVPLASHLINFSPKQYPSASALLTKNHHSNISKSSFLYSNLTVDSNFP